jgi:hypothetical protein
MIYFWMIAAISGWLVVATIVAYSLSTFNRRFKKRQQEFDEMAAKNKEKINRGCNQTDGGRIV